MSEIPTWFSRWLLVALVGWIAVTTQFNSNEVASLKTSVQGVNARVSMLVQFMIPSNKLVKVRP